MGLSNNNKAFAKSASISMPTEPIGSIPRPFDLIDRVAKGGILNSLPSMKIRFETPLSGLKPQAVLSHRRRTEEACPG